MLHHDIAMYSLFFYYFHPQRGRVHHLSDRLLRGYVYLFSLSQYMPELLLPADLHQLQQQLRPSQWVLHLQCQQLDVLIRRVLLILQQFHSLLHRLHRHRTLLCHLPSLLPRNLPPHQQHPMHTLYR